MLEYKDSGFLPNNMCHHLKHLVILNVIIVKKHGCQLTLKSHLSKDAKVVTDIFIQLIYGKTLIKRNIVYLKKRL
jgi:hypothetical protein